MRRMSEALGLTWAGSMYSQRGAIADALRGSGRLIAIDDVDYVGEEALQDLRILNDLAEVGIALVGTHNFYAGLREGASATIQQVLGRVAYVERLGSCSRDDLARIAEPYDLPGDALDVLVEGAGGEARRAVAALVRAQSDTEDGVTADGLRAAFGTLAPPVRALSASM